MATTGKAATVIGGSTVHSHKLGLALPVGKSVFKDLKGKALQQLQDRYRHIVLVVTDEFSMLRQKELHWVDMRLRQAKGNNEPFGGLTVMLSGDTAQLPPVKGNSLWARYNARSDDELGNSKYVQYFIEDIELVEVERVDKNDKDAVTFLGFLNRLRDGDCNQDDWEYIRSQCSQDTMGMEEWKRRGFDNPNLVHLYTTNREVIEHNTKSLKALNKHIVLIEAEHTGNAKNLSDDAFNNLPSTIHLCEGATVLMTSNVCQPVGLCNGAIGTVKDFIYESDATPPSLPKFIWVDFQASYTGPSIFPGDPTRRGWVPVKPMVVEASTHDPKKKDGWSRHSRSMFPLRLSYAFTIWKAQGQTIPGQYVICLSTMEKEHGLTYTAFSRATILSNIGIVGGLSCERLCKKIQSNKKMEPRKAEDQRLKALGISTTSRYLQHLAPLQVDSIFEDPVPSIAAGGEVATVADVLTPTKRAAKSEAPAPRRPKKRSCRAQEQQPPQYRPIIENDHLHSLRSAVNNDRELVRQFCAQTGDKDETIRTCDGRRVIRGSVYRLGPEEWLNDELINYFGALVSSCDHQLSLAGRSRKKSTVFSTFFYSKLMGSDGIYDYDSIKRWNKDVDIFKLDKVLIPINENQLHWIVVKVSVSEKSIELYDPMGQRPNPQLYLNHVFHFIKDEHLMRKGEVLPDASSWRLITLQDPELPTQPNGFDCGVFVSVFIYFSVVNISFRHGLANDRDTHEFADNLRFRFAQLIFMETIHL